MRSVRYCKTILNRLGTYDRERDCWVGKFPPIRDLEFRMRDAYHGYRGEMRDIRVTSTISDFSRLWIAPAQQARRDLATRTMPYPFWGDEDDGTRYYVDMFNGKVRHILRHCGAGKGVILNSPLTLSMLIAGADDPAIRPALLDAMQDAGAGGRRWVTGYLKVNPMPTMTWGNKD